jgi:acyl-coenzyme A thioesterase PaaI-like protein
MIDSSISEKVHANCLLCGSKNPWSQQIKFYPSKDGWIYGEFQANPRLQGYDGILHGGVITSLLDSAMTHCLFHRGIQAVTGDLHVRFLHSVPCDSFLSMRASILSASSSLYKVHAELICKEQVMARAEAKFVRRTK